MGTISLAIGTSHTPLLSIPPETWSDYARNDRNVPELVFPPDGWVMSYDDAVADYVQDKTKRHLGDETTFIEQSARCHASLDRLSDAIVAADPDVIIIVTDDQDEWFFEGLMPSLAVYWGPSAAVIPKPRSDRPLLQMISDGYGDVRVDLPVASDFGLHLIEHLVDAEFDVAHFNYLADEYGGRISRRYPSRSGVTDIVRETPPREQGLPHGVSFVVKRLLHNRPRTILPIFQNTCYPPNVPSARRCYKLGRSIREAIALWPADTTFALVASGGLSHFVVDEEFDRELLRAIRDKDEQAIENLPRHRMYSATSESLNWVTVAGAMADSEQIFSLIDYVPVYRTEAGTGGGWAFGQWC